MAQPDPMEAVRQVFFQECEEQLGELERGLLQIEAGDGDSEIVNAVFRAVHSVKGGAGAFGLDDLVRFAHVFETCLDKVRSDRLAPVPTVLKVLLRAADLLADLVIASRNGAKVDPVRCEACAADLAALGSDEPGARPSPSADPDGMDGFVFQPLAAIMLDVDEPARAWVIRFRPLPALYAKANEAGVLLRELARLGSIEVALDASALPDLAALDPESAYLAWTVTLSTTQPEAAIREVFEFVEGDCDLTIERADLQAGEAVEPVVDVDIEALIRSVQLSPAASPGEAKASVADPAAPGETATAKRDEGRTKASIRVELDRVDRLINLVGELVINQAMLAERVFESGLARSSNVGIGLEDLEQLTREIQDSVMAIRAQPVKSVFQRMPRLVRECAAMTGKLIHLVTEGEGTEVDKTVIEHLSDPLTHMIRNAIDHGIESPERRVAAGKPAEGTVRLAALHRSGRIIIEVADDGGGINRARVREKAISQGLLPADASLTDEETDNLIFLPGFSTTETVSDLSGRGVGMDVVRRSIQSLGGRISIVSRPGAGSVFTLSLPLTLAVLDGMVVTVAGQTMVVPLTAIIETLQPRAADVYGIGDVSQVIAIRGEFVPLIDVGCVLGLRARTETWSGVALLIEGECGSRVTLLVDAIQGQRQVVIKSLEANYRHVPGIAAATILGDGRVALILDVDTVLAESRAEPNLADTGAVYA